MPELEASYDVVIVGGGPAGLSAALVLARCMRRVVVFDAGQPRNLVSHGLHGFLGHDGITPAEFLRAAREEVAAYGVEVVNARVVAARARAPGFEVTLADGRAYVARRLLLATGVADVLPEVPGLPELYGKSVFHCPYCDGFEARGRRVAVYSRSAGAATFAATLAHFSADLVVFTDGSDELASDQRERSRQLGLRYVDTPLAAVEGAQGRLTHVVLATGERLERDVLFFKEGCDLKGSLAASLGCRLDDDGMIAAAPRGFTSVPGVYAAGDATPQVRLVVVAAAEGAQAAISIHNDLRNEEEAALLARATAAQ